MDQNLKPLVQALVDLADSGDAHAKAITGALEQVAKAATSNREVVAAIEGLRKDLRERAENTELVLTPVYNRDGHMTSATIRRTTKGTK